MSWFLIILALAYLAFASLQDLKKREVANWLNFSLILFALAYRAFFAVFSSDLWFFLNGLIGIGVFFLIANLFYYSRVFAGGDAKLLMGLGAVLPLAGYYESIMSFLGFIFLLFFVGGIWGLSYSAFLVSRNKKKFSFELKKQIKEKKLMVVYSLVFAVLGLIAAFYLRDFVLLLLPLIILAFPFLFIYAKSVEESCMIVSVSSRNVAIGDWLYEEIKIKGKRIKPDWQGLNEKDVEIIKNSGKKVRIKQGIPFVPSFLFAFILFLLSRESFWSFFQNLF